MFRTGPGFGTASPTATGIATGTEDSEDTSFAAAGSSRSAPAPPRGRSASGDGFAARSRRRDASARTILRFNSASDVAFYDESGRVAKSRDDGERLAAVALAGAVAECDAFGDARGAQGDFAALQRVFDAVEPRLSPAEQQAATRRGVLNAYAVLYGGARNRRDATLVEAADAAMAGGASLPAVLAAIEAAAAEAA